MRCSSSREGGARGGQGNRWPVGEGRGQGHGEAMVVREGEQGTDVGGRGASWVSHAVASQRDEARARARLRWWVGMVGFQRAIGTPTVCPVKQN